MKLIDLKAAFLTLMFVGGYGSILIFFIHSPWHGFVGFIGTVIGCSILGMAIGKLAAKEQKKDPHRRDQ